MDILDTRFLKPVDKHHNNKQLNYTRQCKGPVKYWYKVIGIGPVKACMDGTDAEHLAQKGSEGQMTCAEYNLN